MALIRSVKRSTTTYRDIPAWLQINDGSDLKIGVHTSYLTGVTQDKAGIMQHDFKLSNGTTAKLYFGADKGLVEGYQWFGDYIKGTNTFAYKELMARQDFKDYVNKHTTNGNYTGWTDTLSDNVSAKLDFKALSQATDASELYINSVNS